ncbi:MAG TPA: ABC transporter permease, partial [Bacillota bacterium]|nr:ABC transporter permease [Bacillota bacterium]
MFMYEEYSNEHREYIRKERITKNAVTISRIIILSAIFALWEIAANMKWIDPFIMSQPSRIVNTVINLSKDGSLFLHTGVTIYETIIGFVSGTVLGTLAAIVLWWSNFTARVLDPYLVVLNALPKT